MQENEDEMRTYTMKELENTLNSSLNFVQLVGLSNAVSLKLYEEKKLLRRQFIANTMYQGILLGHIHSNYLLNWKLIITTYTELEDGEGNLTININPSIFDQRKQWLEDKNLMEKLIDGLFAIFYDFVIGRETGEFKSQFFTQPWSHGSVINLNTWI